MKTEDRIKKEIKAHKDEIHRHRKRFMLWNINLNKWTENIKNGMEEDVSGRIKLIADQASAMVQTANNIDSLNKLIEMKESIFNTVTNES